MQGYAVSGRDEGKRPDGLGQLASVQSGSSYGLEVLVQLDRVILLPVANGSKLAPIEAAGLIYELHDYAPCSMPQGRGREQRAGIGVGQQRTDQSVLQNVLHVLSAKILRR